MARIQRTDRGNLLAHFILFVICVIIGFYLGVWLAVMFFALLSQFIGALSTLVGTFFGLGILLILLFSGSLWTVFRTAIYGLIIGIVISIFVNHTIIQSMGGDAQSGSIMFWIPAVLVIGVIVFAIIYFIVIRFAIVRRKELVFGVDKSRTNRKKKRK